MQVVVIELFAGIMPASAALHKLGVQVMSYFSETANDPLELVAKHWPNAISLGDVKSLTKETLLAIVQRHPGALVWLTGGVPCKDVSSLNAFKDGAEERQSSLYRHAALIKDYLLSIADNLVFTFECTRMADADRAIFSEAFGVDPVEVDNIHFSPLSRPRWWWIGGKHIDWQESLLQRSNGVLQIVPKRPRDSWEQCLLPGYSPCSTLDLAGQFIEKDFAFKCLTTRMARRSPGASSRGLATASASTKEAWRADGWAQPPYQYARSNLVQASQGEPRRLLPCEEELLMGYPRDFTSKLLDLDKKNMQLMRNRRHTLLGNAWSLHVSVFLAENVVLPFLPAPIAAGDSRQFSLDVDAFSNAREQCPYVLDLRQRRSSIPGSLPPDWIERNAYTAGSLAEQVQARKHTTVHLDKNAAVSQDGLKVGPIASLPKGLPPDVHFIAGCAAQSPLDAVQEVPDDFNFAMDKSLELGSAADAWRQVKFDLLVSLAGSSSTLEAFWDSRMSVNSRHVAPKVKPQRVDIIAHSFLWPDTQLPEMLAEGAKPLFSQESTGVFRERCTEPTISEADFFEGSRQYMRSLLLRPPPSAEQKEVVWTLSEKERKIETLFGYFTFQEMNEKYGPGIM